MPRVAAVAAAALLVVACASAPTPSPTSNPSITAQPSADWPAFDPHSVQEAVATALDMSCTPVEQRTDCTTTRPSGARFQSEGPDGTVAADRRLTFSATGPIELESEAQRLFSAVAGAIAQDAERSASWQDQIWAAFAGPAGSTAVLPNGVDWSAARTGSGAELVWSLTLTW